MGNFFGSQGANVLQALIGFGTSRMKTAAARNEAEMLGGQAKYEAQKTRFEIRDFSELVEQNVGRATAITGASGFDSTSRSAEAAINAIIRRGELDKANIRVGGKLKQNKLLYEKQHLSKSADIADTLSLFSAAADSFNIFKAYQKG
jgi:hypothetical protein